MLKNITTVAPKFDQKAEAVDRVQKKQQREQMSKSALIQESGIKPNALNKLNNYLVDANKRKGTKKTTGG
jgi:hypothetical protein